MQLISQPLHMYHALIAPHAQNTYSTSACQIMGSCSSSCGLCAKICLASPTLLQSTASRQPRAWQSLEAFAFQHDIATS